MDFTNYRRGNCGRTALNMNGKSSMHDISNELCVAVGQSTYTAYCGVATQQAATTSSVATHQPPPLVLHTCSVLTALDTHTAAAYRPTHQTDTHLHR